MKKPTNCVYGTCFVRNDCRLNQAIILCEGSHSCLYLCCETFEPLEAVKRLKAGAGEGFPRDPDGRAVLKQQALPQG